MIVTTASSKKEASKIAQCLIEKKLAACVQVFPMTSFYSWKNKMEKSKEILLLIKTVKRNYKEIEKAIMKLHHYEVPEIIEIPIINGSRDYLFWISENC
jgi:periplasmic divalent cation tolerance protein